MDRTAQHGRFNGKWLGFYLRYDDGMITLMPIDGDNEYGIIARTDSPRDGNDKMPELRRVCF